MLNAAATANYTLSLHDALPISKPFGNTPRESARLLIDFGYVLQLLDLRSGMSLCELGCGSGWMTRSEGRRSEEHTSELQSHSELVCRLLIEKKKGSVLVSGLGS